MLGNVATLGAFTRSIPGVYLYKGNPGEDGLVDKERFQLEECPRMQDSPLCTPSPYPSTDALEIFNGNSASGAFGGSNDFLSNTVIGVSGKPALLATEFLEMSFGAPRSAFLELGSKTLMSSTDVVERGAAVYITVAVRGNVNHSEIHTKEVFCVFRFRIIDVAGSRQIEFALVIDQIGFALAVNEQFLLAFTGGEVDTLATCNRPDGDGSIGKLPRQNAFIVSYCAVLAKLTHCILVQIVCVGNLRNTADYNLGSEWELGSDLFIHQPMQGELAEYLLPPRSLADPVTGDVRRVHGIEQVSRYFVVGYQFNFRRKFHSSSMEQNALKVNRL